MKMDILKIEDTDDGGAIVTIEVDRDMLHLAFQQFLNQAIMEKVDETFIEAATREVFEEDELLTESDQSTEEDFEIDKEWKELLKATDDDELDHAVRGMDSNTNTDWGGSFTYPHER